MGAIAEQQEQFPLFNGRRPENRDFGVRLFHPTFENFSRRHNGADGGLASNGAAAVHKFLVCSTDYYDNEKARKRVVTPLLETLLGRKIGNTQNPDETSSDGTILFMGSGIQVPTLFLELKNGIGAGDADATCEVGLLYRKFWSQKEVYRLSPFARALTQQPTRIPEAGQLLPHIPGDSHGIMVMRAWRGVHRKAYRPALDSIAVAGPCPRT